MDKGIEALISKVKKQTESFDTVVLKEDEAKALIAALEQVQSERDKFNFAHKEWNDKTEWVQKESASGRFGFQVLGMHRADVMTRYIAELEAAPNGMMQRDESIFPGVMRCPKCDFSRTHINVTPTGNYAGESVPESCPNGCGPMWHSTYKREYSELYDHKEQISDELAEMKRKCAELEAASVKPVKLPMPYDINVAGERVDWAKGDNFDRDEVIEAIRAADGTVEGSE